VPVKAPVARRARGRPKVSAQYKFEFLQDYYVQVETVRREKLGIAGNLRSAAEACRLLARRGGLAWIVGGDTSGLSTLRKGKQRRYIFDRKGNALQFRQAEGGTVYVRRLIERAETIESRYDEAARVARQDENVKIAWDNMVRNLSGLPSLPPKRRLFGGPAVVINLAEHVRRFSRASRSFC
jgi:hypothetical protein